MAEKIPHNIPLESTDSRKLAPKIRQPPSQPRDVFISDIRLNLNAQFSAYGALAVYVNGKQEFFSDKEGNLRRYNVLTIPLNNTVLRAHEYIEVYAWNPFTDDPIAANVEYTESDEPLGVSTAIEARDPLQLNQLVSGAVGGLSQDTQAIIDAVSELNIDLDFVSDLGIQGGIEDSAQVEEATETQRMALQAIRDSLMALQSGFDLNTLQDSIDVLKSSVPIVEDLLSEEIEIKFYQLIMRLEQTHETYPSLRSADSSLLFPYKEYLDETHTRLIDMKGNKNFMVIFEKSDVPTPFEIDDGRVYPDDFPQAVGPGQTVFVLIVKAFDTFSYQNKNLVFNMIVSPIPTYSSSGLYIVRPRFHYYIDESNVFDFDSDDPSTVLRRTVGIKIAHYLDDDFESPEIAFTTNKRYVRIGITRLINNVGNTGITMNYNGITLTNTTPTSGEGRLSFEIKDGIGNWHEIISSDEIGAITQSITGSTIVRYGDSAGNFAIPSSKTLFRAKLVVEGRIAMSVTFISIA